MITLECQENPPLKTLFYFIYFVKRRVFLPTLIEFDEKNRKFSDYHSTDLKELTDTKGTAVSGSKGFTVHYTPLDDSSK